MPLGQGVLEVNLGIPIIVVCTKIDMMARGERAQYLENNIDFIQRHLRKYCLLYGASFLFVETVQMTNIEILYRYILHRLYDYQFSCKSQVHLKDQLFIPTGFDSLHLIDELCKEANQGELYENRIKRPQGQSQQVKQDIFCDEWQNLLLQKFKKE